MWLLDASGEITGVTDDLTQHLVINGDSGPDNISALLTDFVTTEEAGLNSHPTIEIAFAHSADGRGFSLVSAVKRFLQQQPESKNAPTDTTVVASGLNPDQVSMALQVGFDGIFVTDEAWRSYGHEAWEASLTPLVENSYRETASAAMDSIWRKRAL